uniref:Uncharacterized protein n=1 Tax=Arundo donax TaxID=35708 RepID=A0A0A8ZJL1_ARUDO
MQSSSLYRCYGTCIEMINCNTPSGFENQEITREGKFRKMEDHR